jgi:hypothetical protein
VDAHGIFEQRASDLITEDVLAAEWGVPRADLRKWRQTHLVEGIDWEPQGRLTRYLEPGQKKAAAAFAAPVPLSSPCPDPESPGDARTAQKTGCFVVTRLPANPRILMMREKTAPGEKTAEPELRLAVRDSAKFTLGMEIDAARVRLRTGHTDYFDLVGPAPRLRGRWYKKIAKKTDRFPLPCLPA